MAPAERRTIAAIAMMRYMSPDAPTIAPPTTAAIGIDVNATRRVSATTRPSSGFGTTRWRKVNQVTALTVLSPVTIVQGRAMDTTSRAASRRSVTPPARIVQLKMMVPGGNRPFELRREQCPSDRAEPGEREGETNLGRARMEEDRQEVDVIRLNERYREVRAEEEEGSEADDRMRTIRNGSLPQADRAMIGRR